jgi:glycosyltransferase involved in cell wall biosynthesis
VQRKALIIVENLPVPFDSRVWKEATALREHGYEVSVLCPRGKNYESGYELLEGVHIYRHPMPKERKGAFGYLYEYACAMFWEILYSWLIFFRRGFHVIQGCNPPDHVVLIALPFKLFGVRYIFDHHDASPELYLSKYDKENLLYKLQMWLEKLTFRFSDVVLSTNESYKELAVSRGKVAPDDVFVVRNGPDLKFQAVSPVPDLKKGKKFLVGYVGTMNVQEGLDILVNVAAHIKKQGRRDIQFTCVGGGPDLPRLREMVTELEVADIMNFTGRVPEKDLLEILSTSDVCVNPDKPCDMNNISTMIKIMEYMALGRPIVQFDLKEGRFSAQDASLYADSDRQVEDFAANIVYLLDHPDERARMGEFGIRRVKEALGWGFSVPHLIAAYNRAFRKHESAELLTKQPSASKSRAL